MTSIVLKNLSSFDGSRLYLITWLILKVSHAKNQLVTKVEKCENTVTNLICLSFPLHITNVKFGFHIAHWRFWTINFEDSKQWYCSVLLFGKQAVKVNYFSWSVQWEFWESTALKNWKLSYQSYFYSFWCFIFFSMWKLPSIMLQKVVT